MGGNMPRMVMKEASATRRKAGQGTLGRLRGDHSDTRVCTDRLPVTGATISMRLTQGSYGMKIRSVYLSLASVIAYAAFTQVADAQAQYTLTEIGYPNASYTRGAINNN